VINALCDLYHPTQILADLLTLVETFNAPTLPSTTSSTSHADLLSQVKSIDPFANLKGKKIAWVGDTNNIINEIMVTMPRLGMEVSVASPKGYDQVDERVWKRVYVRFVDRRDFVLTRHVGKKREQRGRSTVRHRQKRLYKAQTS
jgi:ornithine carbamoyltransferase